MTGALDERPWTVAELQRCFDGLYSLFPDRIPLATLSTVVNGIQLRRLALLAEPPGGEQQAELGALDTLCDRIATVLLRPRSVS